MKQNNVTMLVAFVVSVLWGSFADLRHGQWGWFLGRIVWGCSMAFLWLQWRQRRAARTTQAGDRDAP